MKREKHFSHLPDRILILNLKFVLSMDVRIEKI